MVTGHYPLNNNAARVGLEHLEAYYLGWKNLPVWVSRGQTALFVLMTLAIGLTVRRLPARLPSSSTVARRLFMRVCTPVPPDAFPSESPARAAFQSAVSVLCLGIPSTLVNFVHLRVEIAFRSVC